MAQLDPSRVSDTSSSAAVLDVFLEWLIESGIEPYDHQEEAVLERTTTQRLPGRVEVLVC